MKKKIAICVLVAAMALSLAACTSNDNASDTASSSASSAAAETDSSASEEVGMANPNLYDVTEEEMVERTGIDLPAPEGATDVMYDVIGYESDTPMAEMKFTLDGVEAIERAQPTSLLGEDLNADATLDDILSSIDPTVYNISGLEGEFDSAGTVIVDDRDGVTFMCSSEGFGFTAWIDTVPGILYNVAVIEDADMDTLSTLAEKVFVPMQGESDGDEAEAESDDSSDQASGDYEQFVGEYNDSYSQRASATVELNGDEGVKITVSWSSSATENTQWVMTATLDGDNTLRYSDCTSTTHIIDEDDNETVEENECSAEGYFTWDNGTLKWDGAGDADCQDCVFEK